MNYIKIKENDVANGEGITVSLWVSGCPHHCKGCFQPETWDYNAGQEFSQDTAKYILELLDKNGIKRNLSILGGEALCPENIDMVWLLCRYIKQKRPETIIYIWTGYQYEYLLKNYTEELFRYVDYLIDGKFEVDKKDLSLKLRGSYNQRVIDIKETLENDCIVEKYKYSI